MELDPLKEQKQRADAKGRAQEPLEQPLQQKGRADIIIGRPDQFE